MAIGDKKKARVERLRKGEKPPRTYKMLRDLDKLDIKLIYRICDGDQTSFGEELRKRQ